MSELIPSYLETDFYTLKQRLNDLLANSDTFKDYNYSGSNISLLIDMLSYLSELNTFYINKLSKNMFLDTTDVYETTWSMANLRGYIPKGYVAPVVTLNVNVGTHEFLENIPNPGDQLYIPAMYSIDSGLSSEEGNIVYITTEDYTIQIPEDHVGSSYSFDITLKQGSVDLLEYTGEDIINGNLFLPFRKYDSDYEPYINAPGVTLYVNGEPWERVASFTKDATQINENNNVYKLEYNKFETYSIRFSNQHNIPKPTDQIRISILKTFGTAGDVAAFSILTNKLDVTQSIPVFESGQFAYRENYFIKNITKDYGLSINLITIENPEASINSADPESIDEIRTSSAGILQSQYRNVTKNDYSSHLEEYPDVVVGTAWGEKEVNPGDTNEYNKIYISVIPTRWSSSTIEVEDIPWQTTTVGLTGNVLSPTKYNDSLKGGLLTHLAPGRYLNNFEVFVLPELVYFAFGIGIKCKRLYNFNQVKDDVEAKLAYYFDKKHRHFNEIIDFKKIHNFILDMSIRTKENSFEGIRGVENLILRDIETFTPSISGNETYIYEPNTDKLFPQFTTGSLGSEFENILRPIKLGLNQFPVLESNLCIFFNEG